jgi:hypothetical protein
MTPDSLTVTPTTQDQPQVTTPETDISRSGGAVKPMSDPYRESNHARDVVPAKPER